MAGIIESAASGRRCPATTTPPHTLIFPSAPCTLQIVAGIIEERGIEAALPGNYRASGALSLLVRTANTFAGSLLWVDYVRFLGMQTAGH